MDYSMSSVLLVVSKGIYLQCFLKPASGLGS